MTRLSDAEVAAIGKWGAADEYAGCGALAREVQEMRVLRPSLETAYYGGDADEMKAALGRVLAALDGKG